MSGALWAIVALIIVLLVVERAFRYRSAGFIAAFAVVGLGVVGLFMFLLS